MTVVGQSSLAMGCLFCGAVVLSLLNWLVTQCRVQILKLGTHHLISGWGGGGGWSFCCLQTFFFPSDGKQTFFWAINVRQFFFMLCRRNFLSHAFPIMYVTIWCFFLVNIFFINFDNKLFFSAHIFNKLFFSDFCGDKLFFSILI